MLEIPSYLGVVGREVGAYVVQARSTEQGIDHGVDKDVSVAVAGYPLFERDRHAAEHERTPADERMNVHADPRPRTHGQELRSPRLRPDRMERATTRSSGVVTFRLSYEPWKMRTLAPIISTMEASSVTS